VSGEASAFVLPVCLRIFFEFFCGCDSIWSTSLVVRHERRRDDKVNGERERAGDDKDGESSVSTRILHIYTSYVQLYSEYSQLD
jgi:hypothetical protein